MTTRLWFAALWAVGLAGCAHHHEHFRVPDPTRPQIVLTPGGRLVVNQEPIVVYLKDSEPVVITWALPPGSGLSFDPGKGILIIGRTKDDNYKPLKEAETEFNAGFKCEPTDPPGKAASDGPPRNPTAFKCELSAKNKFKIPRGIYTYEINVIGPQGTIKLDPSVMPQ